MIPRLSHRSVFMLLYALAVLTARSNPPPDGITFERYEVPRFPSRLTPTPVNQGFATAAFTVKDSGEVLDAVILEDSHPAFGEALLEAIHLWRLGTSTGTTSRPRREVVSVNFVRSGVVTSMTQRDAFKSLFSSSLDGEGGLKSLQWDNLSTPPQRLLSVAPSYPAALKSKGARGTATVGFVIDATGVVRVPVVLVATEPDFGEAALTAVKQWRFSPPRHRGRPVVVEVVRTFAFGRGNEVQRMVNASN